MDGDIVLRLLELAEPGASFEDAGGRRILRDAADEILAARACAEMMLQGTGQKLGEDLARRVMDEHYPPRWIPVEEMLPEIDENVLASMAGEIGIAHRYVDGWYWDVDEWHKPFTPTHWQPLPSPPDEAT